MAVYNWLARALARAQLVTITFALTWAAADTATVTINGKSVTYTAVGASTTTAATGLYTLLAAATAPEFTAITWANPSNGVITATSAVAGIPFTLTATEVTAGNGTCTAVVTTAATGPNHWDDVNNWEGATVPTTGDTANVNLSLGSVFWGLDQNTVTLASLNVYTTSQTTNTLGLPKINAAGYTEYLDDYLKISATAWVIDADSPRVKINFGSVAFSGEVRRSGSSADPPTPAVLIRGTSTSNVLDVPAGTVGAAYYFGEAFAAATITVGPAGTLTLGSGTTTATTITSLGTLISNGVFTTLYTVGGQSVVNGAPGATTIDVTGGTLVCAFSGTAANVLVGPGTLDATTDTTARTFTNTTIRRDGVITDLPQPTITYTNKVTRASGVTSLQAA
jgi:hypothetical protein